METILFYMMLVVLGFSLIGLIILIVSGFILFKLWRKEKKEKKGTKMSEKIKCDKCGEPKDRDDLVKFTDRDHGDFLICGRPSKECLKIDFSDSYSSTLRDVWR